MLGIAKVDQRVEAGDRFEHHVAALAAVAAVGAAIFDIFFTPETDGAGAAVAGLHENLGLVEEMHRRPLRGRRGFGQVATVSSLPWDRKRVGEGKSGSGR